MQYFCTAKLCSTSARLANRFAFPARVCDVKAPVKFEDGAGASVYNCARSTLYSNTLCTYHRPVSPIFPFAFQRRRRRLGRDFVERCCWEISDGRSLVLRAARPLSLSPTKSQAIANSQKRSRLNKVNTMQYCRCTVCNCTDSHWSTLPVFSPPFSDRISPSREEPSLW